VAKRIAPHFAFGRSRVLTPVPPDLVWVFFRSFPTPSHHGMSHITDKANAGSVSNFSVPTFLPHPSSPNLPVSVAEKVLESLSSLITRFSTILPDLYSAFETNRSTEPSRGSCLQEDAEPKLRSGPVNVQSPNAFISVNHDADCKETPFTIETVSERVWMILDQFLIFFSRFYFRFFSITHRVSPRSSRANGTPISR
jgi:hypothetical protein